MRLRDVRAPLWDILRSAEAIAAFTDGVEIETYERDLMLRSAVERQFEILGEAMTRTLRIDPALSLRLDDAKGVIDFRNVIAHAYDSVSDRTIWDVANNHLPRLREAVREVLEELR